MTSDRTWGQAFTDFALSVSPDALVNLVAGEGTAEAFASNPQLVQQSDAIKENLPDDIESLVLGDGEGPVPAIAGNQAAMADIVEITANPGFHALLRNEALRGALSGFSDNLTSATSDVTAQARMLNDLRERLDQNPEMFNQVNTILNNLPADLRQDFIGQMTSTGASASVPQFLGNAEDMARVVHITSNDGFQALMRNPELADVRAALVERITAGGAGQTETLRQLDAALTQNPQLFANLNTVMTNLPTEPTNLRQMVISQLTSAEGGTLPSIITDPAQLQAVVTLTQNPDMQALMSDPLVIEMLTDPSDGTDPSGALTAAAQTLAANPEMAASIRTIVQNPGFRTLMAGELPEGTPPTITVNGQEVPHPLLGLRETLEGMISQQAGGPESQAQAVAILNGIAGTLAADKNPELFTQLRTLMVEQPELAAQILGQFDPSRLPAGQTFQMPEILTNAERMQQVVAIASNDDFREIMQVQADPSDPGSVALAGLRDAFVAQLQSGAIGDGNMIQRLASQIQTNPEMIGDIADFVRSNPEMATQFTQLISSNPEAAGQLMSVATAPGFQELLTEIQTNPDLQQLRDQLFSDGGEINMSMVTGLASQIQQDPNFLVNLREMMRERPGLVSTGASLMSMMSQGGPNQNNMAEGLSMMMAMDNMLDMVGQFLGPQAAQALEGLLGNFMEAFAPLMQAFSGIGNSLEGALAGVRLDGVGNDNVVRPEQPVVTDPDAAAKAPTLPTAGV